MLLVRLGSLSEDIPVQKCGDRGGGGCFLRGCDKIGLNGTCVGYGSKGKGKVIK